MASRRLGDLLLQSRLVSQAQVDEALALQRRNGGRLGELLVRLGVLTDGQLANVLQKQLGVPLVHLTPETVDAQAVGLVPEAVVERFGLVPIRLRGDRLTVAMVDPLDYDAIDDVRMTTGKIVEPVIVARSELNEFRARHFGKRQSVDEALRAASDGADASFAPQGVTDASPVAELVRGLLERAMRERASDIHFEPAQGALRVRFRVDGLMRDEELLSRDILAPLLTRLKLMADLNIAEHRVPQDGRLQFSYDGRVSDVRVSILPLIEGEKVVLRLWDAVYRFKSLESLGFRPRGLRLLRALSAQSTGGLVLVTGPTGSGKTATLYTLMQEVSPHTVNAMTIEDPVELRLAGINQVAVNTVTGLTFARGLRAILRQDPDVIMVGEVRDPETAEIATRAALTGHRVFSTLHTAGTVESIARLLDMGVEPYLLAPALTGVVAQRLVRRVCPHCRVPWKPQAAEDKWLERHLREGAQEDGPAVQGEHLPARPAFVDGKGCSSCGGTGFHGRLAIQEVVAVTDELRQGILAGASVAEMRRLVERQGTKSLVYDGLVKAASGLTSVPEVMRAVGSGQAELGDVDGG